MELLRFAAANGCQCVQFGDRLGFGFGEKLMFRLNVSNPMSQKEILCVLAQTSFSEGRSACFRVARPEPTSED